MLAGCGGGGGSSGGAARLRRPRRRRPRPQRRRHCHARAVRCATGRIGCGADARMVSVPRDAAGQRSIRRPIRRVDAYIDALTATARSQRRDRYLHLSDLDRGGERLLRLGLERRLRRPAGARRDGAAAVRRRGVRGRAGARRRDRPRHRDPRDRHQRRRPARRSSAIIAAEGTRGRHRRARADHRRHDPRAARHRRRRARAT